MISKTILLLQDKQQQQQQQQQQVSFLLFHNSLLISVPSANQYSCRSLKKFINYLGPGILQLITDSGAAGVFRGRAIATNIKYVYFI